MDVLFNGEVVGSVLTNSRMTTEEILKFALHMESLEDQECLEKMYKDGCDYVYFDDNCEYSLDVENFEIKD